MARRPKLGDEVRIEYPLHYSSPFRDRFDGKTGTVLGEEMDGSVAMFRVKFHVPIALPILATDVIPPTDVVSDLFPRTWLKFLSPSVPTIRNRKPRAKKVRAADPEPYTRPAAEPSDMTVECPNCKGVGRQELKVSNLDSPGIESLVIPCVWCNGGKIVHRSIADAWTRERDAWCKCGAESVPGPYPQDGECKCGVYKHHVHCAKCGKISQVG
jgi:hypothetical protein